MLGHEQRPALLPSLDPGQCPGLQRFYDFCGRFGRHVNIKGGGGKILSDLGFPLRFCPRTPPGIPNVRQIPQLSGKDKRLMIFAPHETETLIWACCTLHVADPVLVEVCQAHLRYLISHNNTS